jgi:hypothetical protein
MPPVTFQNGWFMNLIIGSYCRVRMQRRTLKYGVLAVEEIGQYKGILRGRHLFIMQYPLRCEEEKITVMPSQLEKRILGVADPNRDDNQPTHVWTEDSLRSAISHYLDWRLTR